jgi:hypothetical protein
VIGVVNAKLQSDRIDKVGFAIPARIAVTFLKKNQVKFLTSENQLAVPGPELADRVVPAVAFAEAKSNPFLTDNLLISCKGKWKQDGIRKSINGKVIVSKNGDVIDQKNVPWLQSMMVPACNVLFVEFPDFRLSKWKRAGLFGLELPEQRQRFGNDPFGFGGMARMHDELRQFHGGMGMPRGFGRFGGIPGLPGMDPFGRAAPKKKEPRKLVSLVEKAYEVVGSESADEIAIKRISKMAPLTPGKNKFEQDCESIWKFNRETGLPISRTAKGETRISVDGSKLTVPFKLTVTLVGTKQIDLAGRQKGAAEKVVDVFADLPSEKIDSLTEQQLEQFLDEKEKLDSATTLKFLNRLTRWKIDDRREEIVAAIARQSKSKSRQIRKAAINAMLHWSPSDAAEALVKELDAASSLSKRSWIAKLGKTGSTVAAEKLCELLDSNRLRKSAGKAIARLGEVAEPVLVDQIAIDLKSVAPNEPPSKSLESKLELMIKLVEPIISGESKKKLRTIESLPNFSDAAEEVWEKLME